MQEILKRITKDDVDIVFTKDKVYKLILDGKVTKDDLTDIPLLDSLANIKPIISGIKTSKEFEDFWPNTPITPVMVMRKLNEDDCLIQTNDLEQIIKPLGIYLNNFHSKCPTDNKQPNDYLYSRMKEDIVRIRTLSHMHENIVSILETIDKELNSFRDFIIERANKGYIKQIHGDVNLEHLFKEGDNFCLIDFYLRKKYRTDDPTRDIATLFIDLYQHGFKELGNLLLSAYTSDELIRKLVILQVAKRLLMKYFVYSGGYNVVHYDKDKLTNSVSMLNTFVEEYL